MQEVYQAFATNGYEINLKTSDAAGGNGVLFNAITALKKGSINIRVGLTTGATYGGATIPTTAKVTPLFHQVL